MLVIGAGGLLAELLLLEHYESPWQFAPLGLLGLTLVIAILAWRRPSPGMLGAMRWIMAACVVAGVIGVVLHVQGNLEFEVERDSELGGLALAWKVLRGATPALAPGALAQLGLLGLVFTHRHPALERGHPLTEDRTLMHTAQYARLLAATVALAACAKADAPNTDSAGAAGATTTIAPSVGPSADSLPAGATTTTGAMPAAGGMMDPNSATRDQLAAVPGMTPAAADALVGGRPYADMVAADKALTAAGLDSATRKRVYAQVWKPIDINKATKAEILLIPGVGNRMLHEFEEYRPYKDVAQFDREIGKYVDQTELARLRGYVSIR